MPQLSFETFVSQYFWLVFIILTLYYLVSTKYLPLLSETFKARKRLESLKSSASASSLSDQSKNLIKEISSLKYSASYTISTYSSPFSTSFKSWSSSF